jgi:hypothetical protein
MKARTTIAALRKLAMTCLRSKKRNIEGAIMRRIDRSIGYYKELLLCTCRSVAIPNLPKVCFNGCSQRGPIDFNTAKIVSPEPIGECDSLFGVICRHSDNANVRSISNRSRLIQSAVLDEEKRNVSAPWGTNARQTNQES